MFHYPSSQTEAEREQDQGAVRRSLEIIASGLGRVISFAPTEEQVLFYEVGVFGGTNAYWREKVEKAGDGALQEVLLRAEFEKAGPGFLRIELFEDTAWALRSVGFGLGTDEEGSRERIEQVGKRLAEMDVQ